MTFEDFVDRWWEWVVANSWQLAILIGLITLLTRCLHNASPRLRYGLWLLFLLKVFLPPGLTAPWSLGQWAVLPVVNSFYDLSVDRHAQLGRQLVRHYLPLARKSRIEPRIASRSAMCESTRLSASMWCSSACRNWPLP